MNIRNIDLNLLHVFVTVYECKSITLAAKQLNLSQPAVSNSITRLNNALNMTLFVKNNRTIAPSRQTDTLYADIKCCLQNIELSLRKQKQFDPATSDRTFHIATSNYGEIVLFTKLASSLERCAPNIKIIREFLPIDHLSQYLKNGQLDLGLFFDQPVEKGIHKEILYNDSLVLITGPLHSPLQDNLTIDDIIKLDFISLKNECNNFDFLLPRFINHPDFIAPRFIVATMWSLFHIVSTTGLAAITPLFYAKTLENHLPIKVTHLADIDKIQFSLFWREIETEDPGHKWLREFIKDIFTHNA